MYMYSTHCHVLTRREDLTGRDAVWPGQLPSSNGMGDALIERGRVDSLTSSKRSLLSSSVRRLEELVTAVAAVTEDELVLRFFFFFFF